jgi:hypothetical protein
VGQDTRRVLTELLGLSAQEIERLEREAVIACDRNRGQTPFTKVRNDAAGDAARTG